MTTWVAYYAVQSVAIIVFGGLTAWAIRHKWEDTAFVFGIAVLLTGCNIAVPS